VATVILNYDLLEPRALTCWEVPGDVTERQVGTPAAHWQPLME